MATSDSATLQAALISELQQHLQQSGASTPLGSVGVFHCRQHQCIHKIPIHHPSIILVLRGTKRLILGNTEYLCKPLQLLLLPGNCNVYLENIPDARLHDYLALCISFDPETVQQFYRHYRHYLKPSTGHNCHSAASNVFLHAVLQRVQWCRTRALQATLEQHRQQELLLLLTEEGLVSALLAGQQNSWRQKIAHMLSADLSKDWRLNDVSRQLAVSESSLRRHLQKENCTFRGILEETRLVYGLCLLQETDWQIARVANCVGYQSQSRFSQRFKQRFDLTPSALRQTRLIDTGKKLTVCGE